MLYTREQEREMAFFDDVAFINRCFDELERERYVDATPEQVRSWYHMFAAYGLEPVVRHEANPYAWYGEEEEYLRSLEEENPDAEYSDLSFYYLIWADSPEEIRAEERENRAEDAMLAEKGKRQMRRYRNETRKKRLLRIARDRHDLRPSEEDDRVMVVAESRSTMKRHHLEFYGEGWEKSRRPNEQPAPREIAEQLADLNEWMPAGLEHEIAERKKSIREIKLQQTRVHRDIEDRMKRLRELDSLIYPERNRHERERYGSFNGMLRNERIWVKDTIDELEEKLAALETAEDFLSSDIAIMGFQNMFAFGKPASDEQRAKSKANRRRQKLAKRIRGLKQYLLTPMRSSDRYFYGDKIARPNQQLRRANAACGK